MCKSIAAIILVTFILLGCATDQLVEPRIVHRADANTFEEELFSSYDKSKIYIDLQEEFKNDLVQLHVNGKELYSKTISTPDDGTGFTDTLVTEKKGSEMVLTIKVNTQTIMSIIVIENGSFIGISKDQQSQVEIHQSNMPYFYD